MFRNHSYKIIEGKSTKMRKVAFLAPATDTKSST